MARQIKLTIKVIAYFIMAYILSIFIIAISSMTIHLINNTGSTSDEYKNSVKIVGGLAITGGLVALIATPILAFKDRTMLGLYLFCVLLSAMIGSLAGFAIDCSNHSMEDPTYVNTVRGLGGLSLAAALLVVIGGPVLVLFKQKRILAMVLVTMVLSSLIIAISGMGIHAATVEPSDGYVIAANGVSGLALAGAAAGIIGIPIMAYKMK